MGRVHRAGNRPFSPFFLGLLAFLFLGPLALSEAAAQNVVIAKFRDRGKSRVGRNAWVALGHALKRQGARLVAHKQYLRTAKRNRIRPNRAMRPQSVRRLSKKMNLAGVINGMGQRRGRRYVVTINVISAEGKMVLKRAFRLKNQKFPRKLADELAAQIMGKLGAGTPVAAAGQKPPPAAEKKPPAEQPAEQPASTSSKDAFLPAWARSDKKDEPKAEAPPPSSGGDEKPAVRDEPEVVAQPQPRAKKREPGSVNDALVAVGASFHHRAGLDPRHEASLFPGLRVDAQLFLGTFLDTPVVRDIGIGGMFDMSLGLEYGYSGDGTSGWDADQMQWRAELKYRLALDTGLAPAFVFRVGYGSLSCIIDSGSDPLVLSASYAAPYAGLDIYLMLFKPYLRLFASGSFLFMVAPGEDVDGDGMGFNVLAGLDVDIIEAIHLGIGYDLTQFMMKDNGTGGMGKYSDTYQGFFFRVGYNYN